MIMADLSGQQFGNYRLLRVLGQGGQASVYLGQHLRLQQKFAAIKILHARVSEQDIDAFQQEANTIATLQHPHIVNVLDFDVQQGIPFLVMEYYPGGSLRQRHPRGERVPLPTVISYVKQVAEALQYAHAQRLIHRDVKAANMLIGPKREIVLSDFGIATIAHSTSSIGTHNFAGTAPYMAPEQIRQHPRRESDQYALAVVAYEWLCGEPPFVGTPEEIAIKHLTIEPSSLCQKLPGFSPHVDQIILKALTKDPKARFVTVQAFAIALEQAMQGKEVTVPPLGISSSGSPNQPSRPEQEPPWIVGEPVHPQILREDILVKAYQGVQRGNIADPKTIRAIAAHVQAVANDPVASQSVSFDATHAAQNLYEQARRYELEDIADTQQLTEMQPLIQRATDENKQAIIDRPPQQRQKQRTATINNQLDRQQLFLRVFLLVQSLFLFAVLTVFRRVQLFSAMSGAFTALFGWSAYLISVGLIAFAVAYLIEGIQNKHFIRLSLVIGLTLLWPILLVESQLLLGGLIGGIVGELLVRPLLGWPPIVGHVIMLGLLLVVIVGTFRSTFGQKGSSKA